MTGHDPMTAAHLTRPVTAFDRLYQQRVIFLRGELDDQRANDLVAELLALDSSSDADVTLIIDSPEGSFRGMLAAHDTVRSMGARVHTRCVGVAAPAPAVLLASGTGSRSAATHARIRLGPPRGSAEGTANELETEAAEVTRLRRRAAELLAERTGQPVESVERDMDRDHWLSAEEARDYGLVDEVD